MILLSILAMDRTVLGVSSPPVNVYALIHSKTTSDLGAILLVDYDEFFLIFNLQEKALFHLTFPALRPNCPLPKFPSLCLSPTNPPQWRNCLLLRIE